MLNGNFYLPVKADWWRRRLIRINISSLFNWSINLLFSRYYAPLYFILQSFTLFYNYTWYIIDICVNLITLLDIVIFHWVMYFNMSHDFVRFRNDYKFTVENSHIKIHCVVTYFTLHTYFWATCPIYFLIIQLSFKNLSLKNVTRYSCMIIMATIIMPSNYI